MEADTILVQSGPNITRGPSRHLTVQCGWACLCSDDADVGLLRYALLLEHTLLPPDKAHSSGHLHRGQKSQSCSQQQGRATKHV
jgi:hypothetical protein